MRRGDGVKVDCLTTGGLMDVRRFILNHGVKLAMRSQPRAKYRTTGWFGKARTLQYGSK